jgi:hypothetical protein
VWLTILSDQLPIVALVSRYPTNQLIGRGPLTQRLAAFLALLRAHAVLAAVSPRYPPLRDRFPRVTHPFATHDSTRRRTRPFDLHVLGTPPAFVLSQDQTLHHIPKGINR